MKNRFYIFILLLIIAISVPIATAKYSGALFSASTSNPNNSFNSGTLLVDTDHPASSFIGLNNMVPGDSISKSLIVKNTGSNDFIYSISAISENQNPSLLWTDSKDGLQITITGSKGIYYSGPINNLINKLSTLTLQANDGKTNQETLTIRITLPSTADNDFQGLSEKIKFTINANQLPGSNK